MKNKPFKLDKQLKQDTHTLLNVKGFYILLHKNATIPWIILVPETTVSELYELPVNMQHSFLSVSSEIGNYLKKKHHTDKMNIAAIGNIVSQLHIHIVARSKNDACWPNVVWGHNYDFMEYQPKHLQAIKTELSQLLHNFSCI